ncbi:hypothetical protein VMCG_03094 [Cytospora schulzeri]|uniref:C2H2-type domain-containing protein n=1 Tax=Cytospora schulzeri TaxID=448051 RepID=A0A423WY18_9PEZI|nr:hypothetical protein VMCG_03094 [Valsa malicola]
MTYNNGGSTQALFIAIGNTDEATLRNIIKSMCKESAECLEQASKRLLVPNPTAQKRKAKDDPSSNKKSKKDQHEAVVPRYEVCETCNKSFDITTNNDEACRTHEDELEVDPDYFPDDDEIQSGEHIDVETDWRVDKFPDGFVWQCCEASANGEPCVIQRHIAAI